MVEEYNNWQDIFSSQYEKITGVAGEAKNYPDSDEFLEVRKDAGIPIDLPEDADDKVEAELKAAYDTPLYIEDGEDIEFEDYEHIVKHREKSPIKNLQSLKSDLKILECFQATYENRETSEEMNTLLGNADALSDYDEEVLNHYFKDDNIDTDQLLVDMAQHGDVPTYLNTTANLLSGYVEEQLIPSMIEETQKSGVDIDLGDLVDDTDSSLLERIKSIEEKIGEISGVGGDTIHNETTNILGSSLYSEQIDRITEAYEEEDLDLDGVIDDLATELADANEEIEAYRQVLQSDVEFIANTLSEVTDMADEMEDGVLIGGDEISEIEDAKSRADDALEDARDREGIDVDKAEAHADRDYW